MNRPCCCALMALLLASACASPTKLARQSSLALSRGELRKAYDKARSGIEKDPQHSGAREAYVAASRALAIDYEARVVATAAAPDTIGAADLSFTYREFRRDVARHATILDSVPEYFRAEEEIVRGAARAFYDRGVEALAARRPRAAVAEFTRARRYVADYADVAARLAQARREATVRIVVLPFADRIGVPGLSQEVGDSMQYELSRRIPAELEFTELVNATDLDRQMTVAELKNLRREDAVAIGKRVRANWIVVGAYRAMRSTVSQKTTRIRLYERIDRKDTSVIATTTWEEVNLPVLNRRRDVSMQILFDVIDVETGNVLGSTETNADVVARVTWTDFVANPPFDRYALLPPDVRRAEPKRAKEVDDEWKKVMGAWDLRDFLRNSREQRSRARYASRYRGEFYRDTRDTPVWLGELPGENEMAFVAARDVWKDVLSKLQEMSRRVE